MLKLKHTTILGWLWIHQHLLLLQVQAPRRWRRRLMLSLIRLPWVQRVYPFCHFSTVITPFLLCTAPVLAAPFFQGLLERARAQHMTHSAPGVLRNSNRVYDPTLILDYEVGA